MKYYTLAIKTGNAFFPEFGDYERDVVEQERQDLRESGERSRMRIVVSQDNQSAIEEAIADLNRG